MPTAPAGAAAHAASPYTRIGYVVACRPWLPATPTTTTPGRCAPPGLNRIALAATVHCLSGCAVGEVLGLVLGTALGLSNVATIVLAVALAFVFGYTFTSVPLLRSGLALGAVLPLALAADTVSIAIMEVVDNVLMLAIPGAMDAGSATCASGSAWRWRCSSRARRPTP